MRRLLPLLSLALSACHAAPLDPQWGPAGQLVRLRLGDRLLLQNGDLTVATANWAASVAQSTATEVARHEAGGAVTWTGRLSRNGVDARYTQVVRPDGDGWRVELTLEPLQPCAIAAVVWRAHLPIAAAAGGRWVVAGEDAVQTAPLPATLPQPYSFANAVAPRFAGWLSDAAGLRIGGDIPRLQIQDDRQWQGETYEFQLYTEAAGRLEPGQPVRLSFTLGPLTAALVADEQQRVRDLAPNFQRADQLAIHAVTAALAEVPRFARQELSVDLAGTWDSPFDPDDIDLSATFRAPSGATLTVPGFLYRPYARERQGQAERLKPAGPPAWRVRFAPAETGDYTYTVAAKDRSGTVAAPAGRFRCVARESGGYVRISRDDPRYFALDDGTGWFAIGANVCWPGSRGTYDYDDWFTRYAAAGGNYARLWIGPMDAFAPERVKVGDRADTGLGRYDQAAGWRLDYVTELAERLGIRLMFCIDSFNSLRSHPDYPFWTGNPYNAANGGPLARPEEFFTNATARRTFQHRLRYLVARWGYSTSLCSWEFWNEVDIIDKYISPEVTAWHQEMSRYLRATDPWQHLQTTSFARSEGDPAVDGLPEMDYVQTHRYGARDIAAVLADWSRSKAQLGKPHYVGEFGLSGNGTEAKVDPTGVSLHNGLWATVMSGDAGTGMLWWWDSYIHPLDLYHHFAALHAYLDGVDFAQARFKPLAAAAVEWVQKPAKPSYVDLELSNGVSSWSASPANQPNTFVCGRDGKVHGIERLSYVQHGVRNHKDKHNPATFALDCGRESEFTVIVRAVSGHGGAALRITLDGATALEQDFADSDDTQDTATLSKYDGDYTVPLPPGKHTVVVENLGRDWFMADYVVRRYVEDQSPRLRAMALAGDKLVLAWVQHRDHTWSRLAEGQKLVAVAGARLRLPALAGRWRAERWDTLKGVKVDEETVTATGGAVTVMLPAIADDVALKLVRLP